jgi:NAD(P)-dependent dehydrogenase (short-subunit alcohol dehydrogenase family)
MTGANSGLGFEATGALASHGAQVIMACRDRDRGETARDEIRERVPGADLTVKQLDLGSLSAVRDFGEAVRASHDNIDVLCNNAGVMAIPRDETSDGFERQFGVNHLGHFALTAELLQPLAAGKSGSRVVTQSSGLHENGEIQFSDLHGEETYDKWDAYAQSKLANLLFAYELNRRLTERDLNIQSVACHPGYADTNLQRRGPAMAGSTLRLIGMRFANALLAQSATKGALPMLYAATVPDVTGGSYIGPSGFLNMRGSPARQESSEASRDEATAARLWEESASMTNISYNFADVTAESPRTEP